MGTKAILKGWIQVCLFILVNFLPSGYGSALTIRIRIQESKINADLCGYGYETLLVNKGTRTGLKHDFYVDTLSRVLKKCVKMHENCNGDPRIIRMLHIQIRFFQVT